MSTLLATVALTALTALSPLAVPVPLLPPADPAPEPQQVQQAETSGRLQAADGRLRRGCKDYRFSYAVSTPTEDWTLDITLQDRRGKGVNAQSLIGPHDAKAGVLTYRLCRWATVPGMFTLTGQLVSYDGAETTSATVAESFRLRRSNP